MLGNSSLFGQRENCRIARPVAFSVFLLISCAVSAQQTVVIPAVSDNTPGINGSVWATEVQIIKNDPHASLTVRRLWVCVPEGGVLEDPATALAWDMTNARATDRILTLLGEDLLAGTTSSLGAVALEIEGGEAIVNARVSDVSRGRWVGMTPFGQGQRIPTNRGPLVGTSHVPWVGGCRNAPCNLDPPREWDYYRNNIGFVNPNPEPLVIAGLAVPFGYDPGVRPHPIEFSLPSYQYETFEHTVPPFGWLQFAWLAEQHYGPNLWGMVLIADAGFVVNLDPDRSLPYFAYASAVFAPDPDSGVPAFNDPMFIPAESGFIEPYQPDP